MKQVGVYSPKISLEIIFYYLRWENEGLVSATEVMELVMQFRAMGRVRWGL